LRQKTSVDDKELKANKELQLINLQEVKIISEEKTKLFVRRVKGHLRGIIAALEEFMLSTSANNKSPRDHDSSTK
jgi:hypothetical protein